jgi:hypothetical protein
VTPPGRDGQEPLREIPGLRKRSVRGRTRSASASGTAASSARREDLPLFRETEEAAPEEVPDEPAAPVAAEPESDERYARGPGPRELGEDIPEGMDDLPLRRFDPARGAAERARRAGSGAGGRAGLG